MVEHEGELIQGIFASECEDGAAIARHISSDGDRHGFLMGADNEASAVNLSRKLEDRLGFDPCKTEVVQLPGSANTSSFFGFSSNNWGGSTWEPEGPKPNWRVGPPKDPHAN